MDSLLYMISKILSIEGVYSLNYLICTVEIGDLAIIMLLVTRLLFRIDLIRTFFISRKDFEY